MSLGASAPQAEHPEVADLLRQWASLSDFERKIFAALSTEISSTSGLVESSVLAISERFRDLANLAQDQASDVDAVIQIANFVKVGDESIPLEHLTGFVSSVLLEVVGMIASLSEHAKTMVGALDLALADAVKSESAIDQIDLINQKTRYLSLNALIEASRAGEHGRGFAVVANEVRELSQSTNTIAVTVRSQITAISRRVRAGHAILKEIAALDTSKHIAAKARLDQLFAALTAQNRTFNITLAGAASRSQAISNTVANLVMDMQFQDRATQCLTHVTDTLGVLGGSLAELQDLTQSAGFDMRDDMSEARLQQILERHTMADVRARFARLAEASLGTANAQPTELAAVDHGSIELF